MTPTLKRFRLNVASPGFCRRATAATMWRESGIHIKLVAHLLGRYSTSITGDIYGHGSDDGARRAIEKLGEQLGL